MVLGFVIFSRFGAWRKELQVLGFLGLIPLVSSGFSRGGSTSNKLQAARLNPGPQTLSLKLNHEPPTLNPNPEP